MQAILSVSLALTVAACSSTADSARDGASDVEQTAPDQQTPLADAALDTAAIDADMAPDAGGITRFIGIWRKEKTGAALVVRNDCGEYWRVDFDYAFSQLTAASETTLLLQHCADAACTEPDSSTTTLAVQDDSAVAEDKTELEVSADCTIRTESSTKLTIEAIDRGSLHWRAALTYVGSGCDSIKPSQTKGSSCEAIAQTVVRRLD